MNNEQKEIKVQIEQIKREMLLFIEFATKAGLSNKNREKQINLYLDDISNLLKKLENK